VVEVGILRLAVHDLCPQTLDDMADRLRVSVSDLFAFGKDETGTTVKKRVR
jgi:hypothetical protein